MPTAGPVFDSACRRRYPAWTLYARTLSGSRTDAESLVRRAVVEARRAPTSHDTEASFHGAVIAAIRTSALSGLRGGRDSALSALERDPDAAVAAARSRFARLRRSERRALALLVTKRPAYLLAAAAKRLGVTPRQLSERVEASLHTVANAVHRGGAERSARAGEPHVALETLLAYVGGALAGDEARALATHARRCGACGDRLGTLMLLRAGSVERAKRSWLSPDQKKLVPFAAILLVTAGALVAYLSLRPNPWAEHATQDNVPAWFHDFFYGERRAEASEISRGLEKLVRGDVTSAIRILEPIASDRESNPEAAAYLGVARYLDGDTSRETVRLLTRGVQSSRAGRLARWYLANALLLRRDVDAARSQLEALALTRDWFGRAAEALLEALEAAESDRLSA